MQRVHELSLDKSQQFGDFVDDLLPFLIFAGLPVLGLLMVMALGGLTAKSGLANGRPRVTAAFLFANLGVAMILLGAIANAVQAITNLELVGTVFEEGATLFVVYGAAMAVFGGVLFWAPKLWGRVVPELHSMPLVLLALGGTVLAAGSLIIAGFLDQAGGLPVNDADVAAMLSLDYVSSGELWNWLSLIGHGLMALATLAFVGLMFKVFTGAGETAETNPYGGHTIEWSTTSPAPPDNYEFVPTVASPSPVFDMTYEGDPAVSHDETAGYLALPPAALPPPPRQLLVATALACLAGSTLIGGMLAIWVLLRQRVVDGGGRFPVDYIITEVASNVMLMTIFALCLFAQWAVYAGKRGDRAHAGAGARRRRRDGDRLHQRPGVRVAHDGGADRRQLLRRDVLRDDGHDDGARRGRPRLHRRHRLPRPRREPPRHRDPRRPRPLLVLRRSRLRRGVVRRVRHQVS